MLRKANQRILGRSRILRSGLAGALGWCGRWGASDCSVGPSGKDASDRSVGTLNYPLAGVLNARQGARHGAGGFPAVFWLLLEGLQEDSFHTFGGIGAERPKGKGGVLEDDLVGIGLARVEA